MFDRAHFARFLQGNDFDIKKAIGHFNEYLNWRKQAKIDSLLVSKQMENINGRKAYMKSYLSNNEIN